MCPTYSVQQNLKENERKKVITNQERNLSINLNKPWIESLQNPNLKLQEEKFYLLQRSVTKGRKILSNQSGFSSHPLTRDLVRKTSQAVNCLKK